MQPYDNDVILKINQLFQLNLVQNLLAVNRSIQMYIVNQVNKKVRC